MGIYAPVYDSGWQLISAVVTNSWVSYTTDGEPTAGYRLLGNTVCFRGAINGGLTSSVAFNLPTGYRPTGQQVFLTANNGNYGQIAITSVGAATVYIVAGANPTRLDGINFTVN